MKNNIKLRVFIGLTTLIVILCATMVLLLVAGAEGLADKVKWIAVAVSILFMSLTVWLSKN